MSFAYLLVSHGSRDPRPEVAMQQLARLVCDKLPKNYNALNSEHLVGIAALEMSPQPLHEQIQQFAKSAFGNRKPSQNQNRLKIVPLFLLPGVHVMTDIPAEVALAQQAIGEDIMIELQPYLGSHPNLEKLLVEQIATIKAEAWIFLAHGSRRPGSKETVEAMAASLSAVAAYWATPPSLESRVTELVTAGYKEIAILPYFLFAGGITDAIAASIEELKLQFPAVNFQLAQPLGASAELAELIWDLTDR
ncbi:sirohydrochlorin chelatase [Nostoc sp. 'Peltigera membranacea cyanobiont' 213]|uniref:sirohydrochlorin chelatase n=1 Tax=unclassified Nostoc TaxID=2593658 RepID=UPI000B9504DF|nr:MULTISPECIES: sirohydrochlorin chelatase [unclassified Nostoc]AVH66414.1 sirohydrochlorin cobaltochelatase [Nostoc sp. 'Peltigera membranacea cyanobiont' N6]OYD88289.1 sirohydrochlorin chelatase [Nostoc sp. 'Peltigera membranacea cyanobiont' 213]